MRIIVFEKIKSIKKQILYIIVAFVVTLSTATSAHASSTFTSYPISSGRISNAMTSAAGSLWYLSSDGVYIGNMTTAGASIEYNVRTLSGLSTLVLSSITTGPDGNIWFSGNVGSGIYTGFLNISTGAVTTYSSGGLTGTLNGKIISGSDGRLWYAYKTNTAPAYTYLVGVDPSTGVKTIGYNTLDTYANYTDIASGQDGNIWVTDAYYNKVLKFTLSSGSAYLNGNYSIPTSASNATGIVAGTDGNLWFRENYTGKIVKVTTSGVFSEYSPAAGISLGGVLTVGPDNTIWLAASVSGIKSIVRVNSSGVMTTYTIPGSSIVMPAGFTLGPDGAVWFDYQDSGGAKLGRLVVTPDFSNYSTSSTKYDSTQITTAAGSLWYLATSGIYIGSMTTSGTTTNYDIRALSGLPTLLLSSITTGPDGNIWFSGRVSASIYTGFLNVSTGAVTAYSSGGLSGTLSGKIVSGSDGKLWYTYKTNTSPAYTYLVSVNPSTGATTVGYNTFDTYANYVDIAAGPDGNLWVTDAYYNRIKVFTPSSGSAYLAGNYLIPTASSGAAAIAAGSDGNLWFRENYTGKLVKVTTGGSFTEYSPSTGVSFGTTLAAGPDGAIWLPATVSGIKSLARVTSGGVATTYAIPGSSVTVPSGLTLGPDGAVWFNYTNSTGGQIGRLGY